ncbi:hypothetical protein EDD18DRAFT_1328048 [Armillaria luteobubalina]|uniref:Uncharacterized protein n=1 Tax=Armillaria luteobubalina TaxID=153913 RepID=A0AA39TWE7_9AGAR|nr:hypothetical protein EDD18DRAFT_1328048 [Armillaria luteobubalina]
MWGSEETEVTGNHSFAIHHYSAVRRQERSSSPPPKRKLQETTPSQHRSGGRSDSPHQLETTGDKKSLCRNTPVFNRAAVRAVVVTTEIEVKRPDAVVVVQQSGIHKDSICVISRAVRSGSAGLYKTGRGHILSRPLPAAVDIGGVALHYS